MTAVWVILVSVAGLSVIGLVLTWIDYKLRPVQILEVDADGPCPCPDCHPCVKPGANVTGHHSHVLAAPGTGKWVVARPPRDTSWWRRRKQEKACAGTAGHCWHAGGFIDWWCCMCSGEVDGMPDQRCIYCVAQP